MDDGDGCGDDRRHVSSRWTAGSTTGCVPVNQGYTAGARRSRGTSLYSSIAMCLLRGQREGTLAAGVFESRSGSISDGEGLRKGFAPTASWSNSSATFFGRRHSTLPSVSRTPARSGDDERWCLGSRRARHVVVAVGCLERDPGEWRRLPAPSPREVVLPGFLAVCQTRAGAQVFPVTGECGDSRGFDASFRDTSVGRHSVASQERSAGRFNAGPGAGRRTRPTKGLARRRPTSPGDWTTSDCSTRLRRECVASWRALVWHPWSISFGREVLTPSRELSACGRACGRRYPSLASSVTGW